MKFFDNNGSFFSVTVLRREVISFKRRWPCSGLRDMAYTFQFDKRNGDLIDTTVGETDDGGAASALSQDARDYGAYKLGVLF